MNGTVLVCCQNWERDGLSRYNLRKFVKALEKYGLVHTQLSCWLKPVCLGATWYVVD